ncbi:hypothetical protein Q5P01_015609 [Channa striata]|uniref:PDZ domain-containing protein n=1 Tax=Channa striata TaxID=64152 RepID=A0AA88MCI4_CHASR|nr:hypothetical protein Q5P01_015609 [Channa striata]
MKRHCFPVRGDHDLLTPNTHTQLGVRLCPAIQVRSEGEVSHSGHLTDSSKSAAGLTRQCAAASPSRRLRFDDETETEAESRYLERQKRRAGSWCTGALTSKPILNMYINSKTRRTLQGRDNRADLKLHTSACDDRGRSPYRTHLNLRTEPIRETYIGFVTPGGTRRAGLGAALCATPTKDPPINPYAPDQVTMPTFRYPSPPTATSLMMKEVRGRQHQAASALTERGPCVDLRRKSPPLYAYLHSQALPTSETNSGKQVKQPMRAELHSDDTQLPEQLCRGESSRLSLDRLFSSVRLSRGRTGSLDRHSLNPRHAAPKSGPEDTRTFSTMLKKCPSVQSLSMGAPFSQLKRSSVQSLGSEQKKENHHSVDNRPVDDRFLRQTLRVEDISCPGSSHSVGRVLQVCSDRTFDLELSRPTKGTFGFSISRRRSCPDSGVYVEDMVDCSTEKLYAGLLSVGDEILEVNGKTVAGLSLDQVTELLTQNPSATVRIKHN